MLMCVLLAKSVMALHTAQPWRMVLRTYGIIVAMMARWHATCDTVMWSGPLAKKV